MLLRLLVSFYFTTVATVLGNYSNVSSSSGSRGSLSLSVAQSTQYQDDCAYPVKWYPEFTLILACTTTIDLTRRQSGGGAILNNQILRAGILTYSSPNFQGPSTFWATDSASKENPVPFPDEGSFKVFGNVSFTLNSTSDSITIIMWDPASDISSLPLPSVPFNIVSIDAVGCLEPCTSAGKCNPYSAVCTCPSGFTGTLCEKCADKHFGPKCRPCPSNCTSCDEGISGSGLCLVPTRPECKCKNGECDDKGECKCLPGYGPSKNGTECALCMEGYFWNFQKSVCQSMI